MDLNTRFATTDVVKVPKQALEETTPSALLGTPIPINHQVEPQMYLALRSLCSNSRNTNLDEYNTVDETVVP